MRNDLRVVAIMQTPLFEMLLQRHTHEYVRFRPETQCGKTHAGLSVDPRLRRVTQVPGGPTDLKIHLLFRRRSPTFRREYVAAGGPGAHHELASIPCGSPSVRASCLSAAQGASCHLAGIRVPNSSPLASQHPFDEGSRLKLLVSRRCIGATCFSPTDDPGISTFQGGSVLRRIA